MKKFFVMDIETFEEDGRVVPYLYVIRDENDSHCFFSDGVNDITSIFLSQIEILGLKNNLSFVEVYTHNINFDGFILIEYFLSKSIPFKWFIRNLNLYYVDFSYKGFEIRIRCSYKILGASVKNLGVFLNKPKQIFPHRFMNRKSIDHFGPIPKFFFESDVDYEEFSLVWGYNVNVKKVSISYSKQDVDIVYESLIQVFKIAKNSFSNSFSFSSYSYKLFAKKYDFKKISKVSLSISERNYIENSYFGGRTEIFGNTKTGLIHRFDFPGMYGSCMKEKFPYGKSFFSNPNDFKLPGFYTVTVISDLKIPLLPIRTKNKKIIYPNGRFTTTLSRDEFTLFIEKGGKIDKIHGAMLYPKEDYIFKSFIEDFDEIKSMGGFNRLYGKQVINSLYGSFALKKDKTKYVILYDEKELMFLQNESKVKSFMKFDKIIVACIELKEDLNPRENRNVSYSAFISSKARIKLHKNVYAVDDYYSKKYGDEYKILYLETDSIDVSLPESRLGENIMDVCWQKVYKQGVFISPKFYFLKEDLKSKIKGISKSKYTYEEISYFFYEDKESLLFESQLQFFKKNLALSQVYMNKTLQLSSYDKRIFSKDKLSTKSIRIWE